MLRFAIVAAAVAALALLTGALPAGPGGHGRAAAAGAEMRTVDLAAGFNGFTYTGAEAVTPAEVAAGVEPAGALTAIFRYDASTGGWKVWRPSSPAFVNTFDAVAPWDALFLQLDGAGSWTGPATPFDGGTLELQEGFNLAPALFADGADPVGLFGSGIAAVFELDAGTQGFRTYRPSGPSTFNTLDAVGRFGALWVLATRPMSLSYDGFSGPPSISAVLPPVAGPDGVAQVIVQGGPWSADLVAGDVSAGNLGAAVNGQAGAVAVTCDGAALVVSLDPPVAVGTLAVDIREEGATVRTTVEVTGADTDGLTAAVAATRTLVDQCVTDPELLTTLDTYLAAAETHLADGDAEAAADDLAALVSELDASTSDGELDALVSAATASITDGVGALVPSLFDAIGDALQILLPIGIFY